MNTSAVANNGSAPSAAPGLLEDGRGSRILDRTMPVAGLPKKNRAAFLQLTYLHFVATVIGFAVIEVILLKMKATERAITFMLEANWLLILGAFMVVAWLAIRLAHRARALPAQYGALVVFLLAQAVIFAPLLHIALTMSPDIVSQASVATLGGFGFVTALVLLIRKEFVFVKALLLWCGLLGASVFVASFLTSLPFHAYIITAVIAAAGVTIFHVTTKILHSYPEDRYVAASLELFASIGLMFWFVLRLVLPRRSRRRR